MNQSSFQRSNGFALSFQSQQQQQQQQLQLKQIQQQQHQQQQQQQQLKSRQAQPLTTSQIANIQQAQQYREAQQARAKLNSHKSFDLEDDLEFYPNQLDLRSRSRSGVIQHVQNHDGSVPLSPYGTPTKINGSILAGQRIPGQAGYMSPQVVGTTPQKSFTIHQQTYTSPQGLVRRLDLPNSPMYNNSPTRW